MDCGNAFIWLKGTGVSNKIFVAKKKVDGSWDNAIDLGSGINDLSSGVLQDNPHITPDGKGLLFVSNRSGGAGGRDIWFAFNASGLLDGAWSTPIVKGD